MSDDGVHGRPVGGAATTRAACPSWSTSPSSAAGSSSAWWRWPSGPSSGSSPTRSPSTSSSTPTRRSAKRARRASVTGCKLLQTDPLEGFSVRLKVSTYTGIALAMPVLLWQLWRFVTPGLYPKEKRYAVPFIGGAIVLFVIGAGHRLLDHAQGAASSSAAIGGDETGLRLLAGQVPAADRLHDAGVRGRLRVPDRARSLLQLIGIVDARAAGGGPPVRHRGHRGARRRHHAVGRPDQHARAHHPDVHLLRGVDRHRAARAPAPGAGAAERERRRRPRSGRRSSIGCRSRPTRSSSRRSTPSTPAGRCWSPRRPGRARRSWPSTPSTWRWPTGARRSTRRRSRRCRTRSSATCGAATAPTGSGCSPATTPINGDAPVVVMTTEVLRNMIYASVAGAATACATSCSTRSTTSRTPTGARCGRRSSSTCPAGVRPGVPVGHGVERRGARRVDHDRAGAVRRGHRGAAPGRAGEPLPRRRQGPPRPATCCRRWSTAGPTRRRTASTPSAASAPPADAGPGAAALLHAPSARGRRAARRRGPAPGDRTSSSAGRRATTPSRRCVDAGVAPHRPPRSASGSERSSRRARPAWPTATSASWATTAGSPGSRPASPPTTPAWCRRSRRRWRPASPRGW